MISVLTVNYHSAADVAELAESILAARCAESVELLITNNSPDDCIEIPPVAQAWTRVINAPRNLGYGAGINRAAAAASGDILFAANPDLRLTPGALDDGAKLLRERADVGIVLPRLFGADGEVQRSVRRFYTWPVALYARCPLRDRIRHPRFFRDYLMLDADLSKELTVDWGLGGAMFLRRRDYAPDSGGTLRIFDERFFLYFEDVDLCLRNWQSGRSVLYAPQLSCRHAHRRHSRRLLSSHVLSHAASMIRFVRKHAGFPRRTTNS